jgi:acetylornithine deacetylase
MEPELARVLDELASFVALDSVSGGERAYAEAAAEALAAIGFATELVPAAPGRPNVVARRGSGRVLFCTHLDTVPPFIPARREPDRLYGRGACDAKGAFACMLAAARRLLAAGADDLAFLLVVGEEVDHRGAKAAAELDLKADAVILGEPTEGRLMMAQKGILRLLVRARGRAAHSGYPETGESAIEKLLLVLTRMRALELGSDPLLGPAFLNIGRIAGGVAANVLAPAAEAELLLRTVTPPDALIARLRAAAGEEAEIELAARTDPIHLHTLPGFSPAIAGFATDAPYLTGIGPVLLAGPGSIKIAHTAEEHVTHADLQAGIELYVELARRVLAGETPLPALGPSIPARH